MLIQNNELFIGVTFVIAISLTMVIYTRNIFSDFFKLIQSQKINQLKQNLERIRIENETKRKKSLSSTIIICSFPIHQIKRPEAPLY